MVEQEEEGCVFGPAAHSVDTGWDFGCWSHTGFLAHSLEERTSVAVQGEPAPIANPGWRSLLPKTLRLLAWLRRGLRSVRRPYLRSRLGRGRSERACRAWQRDGHDLTFPPAPPSP